MNDIIDITNIDYNQASVRNQVNTHIQKILNKMEASLTSLENDSLELNIIIFGDVLQRVKRDLRGLNLDGEPDRFKKGWCLAFWIRRLKPLKLIVTYSEIVHLYINEIFAITMASYYIKDLNLKNKELFNELIYDLRYRAISPHSLMYMFKALCNPQ